MSGIALSTVLIALLLAGQGPRQIEIDENTPIIGKLVVPAGTSIPVKMINGVSARNAREGDGVYVQTIFPIAVSDQVVIPVGSYLSGKVVAAKPPGRFRGEPSLTLSFQTIVLPSGTTIDLYSHLGGASQLGEREGEASIEGENTRGEGSRNGDIAATATTAAGGIAGSVIGASVGGRNGAIAGTAIGAGVGIAAAILFSPRGDLVLRPGDTLDVVLDRPLEF